MSQAHADFSKGLNAHASFRVNDKETGKDLVQATFLKTWNYLVKGGKIHLMKAFLYNVLNNLVVDEYRKRKTASLDLMLEKGLDPSTGGTERLIDGLDGKKAMKLIGDLPLKYRRIMMMRYAQELTLEEISLKTGQSRNVVAVQTHRGLAKLKLLYKN